MPKPSWLATFTCLAVILLMVAANQVTRGFNALGGESTPGGKHLSYGLAALFGTLLLLALAWLPTWTRRQRA